MSSSSPEKIWLATITTPARILLVDDNPDDIELFKRSLVGLNVQLSVCLTGEEALDLFFQHKFVTALLDLKLPGRSGSEVFKIIRARDRETPIAILSGYIDENIERDLPQFGRVTFMDKRFADIQSYLIACGVRRLN